MILERTGGGNSGKLTKNFQLKALAALFDSFFYAICPRTFA